MTEISRLNSTSASIMVVLGLFYFGVLAYLTATYVAVGLGGRLNVFMFMAILACAYSARMFWSWIGLIASCAALNFRGLYIKGDRLALVGPVFRAFALAEITGVRAGEVKIGPWWTHHFVEFAIKGGGKWRIPALLLEQEADVAVARAKRIISPGA